MGGKNRPDSKPKKQGKRGSEATGHRLSAGMAVVAVLMFLCTLAKQEMRQLLQTLFLGARSGGMLKTKCGNYHPAVPGCSPRGQSCGHLVMDGFASAAEVDALRALAARGMALGGGAGGPTILDLQSGALSYGEKFIDVWTAFNVSNVPAFTRSEVQVYRGVVDRIAKLAQETFGIDSSEAPLHLTSPTFFSRISGDKPPKTAHDEYWHTHTDLEQYGSFVFTSLLYLADHEGDFTGGAFQFMPRGTTYESSAGVQPVAEVLPARGRLVLFSSGEEHPHRITRVERGTRLALTTAFSCDPSAAVKDFLGRALPD